MDSPQSVVSPFKNLSVSSDPTKKLSDLLSTGTMTRDGLIGVLDVFVHHARDIHNICIYHKQDVYSKICLTSDPDDTVTTKIINGGGKNPVFNDLLHLDVRTLDSSLKCEVWMMSRVKNYLGDQLLGFALVPMSEILINNGKLDKEFTMSSTDLFHSPAGFIRLSICYTGASPEVVEIPAPCALTSEIPESDTESFNKIEFPDLKVDNEVHQMVSEYFGLQRLTLDSQSSDCYVSSDDCNRVMSSETLESFSEGGGTITDSTEQENANAEADSFSPTSVCVSSSKVGDNNLVRCEEKTASGSASVSVSVSVSSEEVKDSEKGNDEGETDSSCDVPPPVEDSFVVKPVVVEAEQDKVVQQDIVDMYMKSMQQFTESLEKMNLPALDTEDGKLDSPNSSTTDKKLPPMPKSKGSRVFYGSRAFF